MKRIYVSILALLSLAALLPAQGSNVARSMDQVQVQVVRAAQPLQTRAADQPGEARNIAMDSAEGKVTRATPENFRAANLPLLEGISGTPVHPVYFEHRRPVEGCEETVKCGELLEHGWSHNLRTTAGTTWQYNQMAGTTAAVAIYAALTNTAITPAEADTTLSGEISSNGLNRLITSPTNSSTTLSVPAAATATVVGTTGATSYYYWVASCNQGICTTPSLASNNVTTANATLSTTNYVSVAFLGQIGAATYQMYRTTSSSAPSGTATVLVGGSPACTTTGATVNCTWLDQSNTLTSVTIPASNLTNFGWYTLVKTWTATATQAAQAFGIFNASSSGTLVFEGIFTPVTLNNGDTFTLTETVYM